MRSIHSTEESKRSDIDRVLQALGHPLRRRMLVALSRENGSAKSLSRTLRAPLGVTSYHLNKVLDQRCGVVDLLERVPRRGASEKVYRLRRESILGVLSDPDLSAPVRQGLQGASLKQFFIETIAAIDAGSVDVPQASTLEWDPVQLDDQGWEEIGGAAEEFKKRVKDALEKSGARSRSRPDDALRNAVIGIAIYESPRGRRSQDEAM